MTKEQQKVLDEFTKLWTDNPDMRFFQLIECVSGQRNQFYTSDAETLKLLNNTGFWMGLHD